MIFVRLLFFYLLLLLNNANLKAENLKTNERKDRRLRVADSLYYHNPDSSFTAYDTAYKAFKIECDTTAQINCLRRMGLIRFHQTNAIKALQFYTSALQLANESNTLRERALCLSKIGNLYCKYGELNEGGRYIYEGHYELLRHHSSGKKKDERAKLYSYLNIAELEIRKNNIGVANKNLDTCFQIIEKNQFTFEESVNVYRIKSNALKLQGKSKEAEDILLKLYKRYRYVYETEPTKTNYYSGIILVCASLGQIYHDQNKLDKSLSYLKEGLRFIERLKKKTDNKSFISKRIAKIYAKKGQYQLGYRYRTIANTYFENNLNILNKNNKGIFGVRNKHQEEIEKKETELIHQKLQNVNQAKRNLQLRLIILILLIVIIISGIIWWNKIIKAKHNTEKVLLEKEKKQQEEEALRKLLYKNKELTSNSLQLMERDDLLDRFVAYLKNDNSVEAKTLKVDRARLESNQWEEFEKRFIDIHKDFYNSLLSNYPSLTNNDLKFCALVKLNLKGKDISRLMGMTENSVHTARYRIRKKMGLNSKDSLEEIIGRHR